MTTQTLVHNGLLDDLLICEHCDEPMKVSQGNKPPDYQCTKSAGQPPGSCPTPTFNAKQLDREILAEIADTLITPDTLERLVAATRRIPSSSADISESDFPTRPIRSQHSPIRSGPADLHSDRSPPTI